MKRNRDFDIFDKSELNNATVINFELDIQLWTCV